jgi:D-beta-D-heptose 7-phosphate kinase / D-beta-D-heptose 1-phosphate adenosyltransferase
VVIGEALLYRVHDGTRLGGGALSAAMLARMGVDVEIITAIDDGADGLIVRSMLEAAGVVVHPYSAALNGSASVLHDVVDSGDAILVSDQGAGLLVDPWILGRLQQTRKPIVWDPHPLSVIPVSGSAIVAVNERDAAFFSDDHDPTSTVEIAEKLRCCWDVNAVVVTLGKCGAVLVCDSRTLFVPTDRVEGDPIGAGDAFVAAATYSIAQKEPVTIAVTNAVAFARDWVSEASWA